MSILTKLSAEGCTWQQIAIARSAIPLVLVAIWSLSTNVKLVLFGTPTLWMRSLAGSCSLVGTFFALTKLPPSDVYTLSQMFPIWVAVLSWPILGVIPHWSVWLAVLSSVAGLLLVGGQHFESENIATYVVICVSLFTAIAMMGLHKLKGMDPRAIVVHFSLVSLAFSIGAALFFDAPPAARAFSVTHGLLLVGVGATATFGQILLTKAFAAGDPTKLSVVGLVQVLIVMALEAIFLDQPIADWRLKLVGTPLVLLPTAWVMLARRGDEHPPAPVPVNPPVGAELHVGATEAA